MENLKQKIVQYMAMENYIVKLYSINDELLSTMDEFAQMKSAVDKNDYNGMYFGLASDSWQEYHKKIQGDMEKLSEYLIMAADYIAICLDASIKEDEKFQEVMENLNKMKIEDK